MSNYLKIKFNNNIEEFKRWCNTFPNMLNNEILIKNYYQIGDYYLEINKVRNFLFNRTEKAKPFLGLTFRKYNPEDKDFNILSQEEEKHTKKIFRQKIYEFCINTNLTDQFKKEFS